MEHRWGQRVNAHVTARVEEASGSAHLARIVDLSISGAFLRIVLPVSTLRPIYVELPAPSQKRGPVVEAHVVRRTEDGVGIEWADLGALPVLQLLAILQPSAQPPAAASAALRQSG